MNAAVQLVAGVRSSSDVKLTRLRTWRDKRTLTQQELADRARIDRTTVLEIEAQRREPRPSTIRRLAKALGVKAEDLR